MWLNLKQMKVVKKLKTASKPDGSTYAAPFHKLYVSDERGGAEAIVDVQKYEIVSTSHFDSETGMPQYDPIAHKVYVNLQDQNIFAIIEPATDKVIGRYSVGRCKGNHGMALDPEHHRAFLACEENNLVAVFDLDKHAAIAFLRLADGPDVIKCDAGLAEFMSPATAAPLPFSMKTIRITIESSRISVFNTVHSLAIDTATHRVYAPEQE